MKSHIEYKIKGKQWLSNQEKAVVSSFEELWDLFLDGFPLLSRWEETPQDPEWHAEGNVKIHTQKVVKQTLLWLQKEGQTLDEGKKLQLLLSAFFHDVAKPSTTQEREIKGVLRIVAPRHAERGRNYVACKLLEFGFPISFVWGVMQLVGSHHIPKQLILKEQPIQRFQRLARQVDLFLLYPLTLADMKGRVCSDLEKQIEILHFFRYHLEEYQLWNHTAPYSKWIQQVEETQQALAVENSKQWNDGNIADWLFLEGISEYESQHFYAPEEALHRKINNDFPRLVVTCGPSGSGKSRWIQEKLPHYSVVSLDQIRFELLGNVSDQSANKRVLHIAKGRLEKLLRAGDSVVWDSTGSKRDFRNTPLEIGREHKALTTLLVFLLPEYVYLERNKKRENPVPQPILQKQIDFFEWPEMHEAHRMIFIDEMGQIAQQFPTHHFVSQDSSAEKS